MRLFTLIFTSLILFPCTIRCESLPCHDIEVQFKNPSDGTILSGTLTLPESATPAPAVVLIHGSGPLTRDLDAFGHKVFADMADYLSKRGIAVLRYDKRGCGKSGGTYIPYQLEQFTADGLAGVEFLHRRKEIDPGKVGAIAISQGGLIAPMMAAKSKHVKFIVLLAAPGIWGKDFFCAQACAIAKAAGFTEQDTNQIKKLYDQMYPLWIKPNLTTDETQQMKKLIEALWQYEDMPTRKLLGDTDVEQAFAIMRLQPLRDALTHDPTALLQKVTSPVLALNGSKDVQVPYQENLPAIEAALKAGGNKHYKIQILENHNHLFQSCQTGQMPEYMTIKESISPLTLQTIKVWIFNWEGK